MSFKLEWLRELNKNLVDGYKRISANQRQISRARVLGIVQLFSTRLREDLLRDNETIDDALGELEAEIKAVD